MRASRFASPARPTHSWPDEQSPDFGYEVRLVRVARIESGEADMAYALTWLANDPAALVGPMLKCLGEHLRPQQGHGT